MLEVVSEKTGYPQSMLELSMDMEAQLGIDSIKRVEILAAVQERAPGMPDVDASHMGSLATLGEIVDYMRALMTGTSPGSAPPATEAPAPAQAPAPSSEPSATSIEVQAPTLGRYALELCDAPPAGLTRPGLYAAEVLVTPDGGAVAPALVAELARRGLRAKVAETVPPTAEAVVFLGGLRPVANEDEAIAVQREAFGVARTVAPRFTEHGGLLVTVQDTGGGFGLEPCPPVRAYLGGIPALVKTARHEWPRASVASIDIAMAQRSPAEIATALVDELLAGGGELEVALSATGQRRTLRSFAEAAEPTAPVIGPQDVIVVSGGARGVTAACVRAWAADCGARFVLLGRTPLDPEPDALAGVEDDAAIKQALLQQAQAAGESITPLELSRRAGAIHSGREVRATLAALEAAGATARYVSVDVNDAQAIATALDEVRAQWGPITGLLHGAGVLADKPIATLDDASFDRVFDTKVGGLRALLQATARDPLKVLCPFSSVSARCGNTGQSAYAMANGTLDKVVTARADAADDAVRVRSMGWGPWEGGMVDPALRRRFAELGVPMIPLPVGARMLVDELRSPRSSSVEVVLGGEPRAEALLVEGSEQRVLRLEVRVDRRSHPYLADHAINGTAVVPVVLALEWMSRLARAFRPDLHLRAIDGVRVLRGIKLAHFEGEGDRFVLSARALSNGHGAVVSLEIAGSDGTPHYRAEASMTPAPAALETSDRPAPEMQAWSGSSIYGDVLFHGLAFQVIESLEGVGPEGIAGTLRGVEQAGWSGERWQTDPAALDGALQLAVLWARDQLGRAMLPMGVGSLQLTSRPVVPGPLRCVVRCRECSGSRVEADVALFDAEGHVVSELRGAELVERPDMPARIRG